MTINLKQELDEIISKQKGLVDILYANSSLIEHGSDLRVEGATSIAEIAVNIENALEDLLKQSEADEEEKDSWEKTLTGIYANLAPMERAKLLKYADELSGVSA